MGAVTFSIDSALVEHLRDALPIEAFVESGTFEGETIQRVLPYFDEIHSIELSDSYFANAVDAFASDPAVHLHHGDSPAILSELRPILGNRSVLYWIDAHWCVAEKSAGSLSQCPLLAELDALGELNDESVVIIDDARLFVTVPPDPHETANWPRLGEVIQRLSSLGPRHQLMIVNDVFILFPEAALPAVSDYARIHGVDWLAERHRLARLEQEHEVLSAALSERLAAINDLTEAAEERMVLIDQLTKALAACEVKSTDAAPPGVA
jgi:hypothetical protein